MTPQEKDLLTTLLARLKGAGGQPKDPEADALIRQAMAEQPDMPYYLVQTVLIQVLSLVQAQILDQHGLHKVIGHIRLLSHRLADQRIGLGVLGLSTGAF